MDKQKVIILVIIIALIGIIAILIYLSRNIIAKLLINPEKFADNPINFCPDRASVVGKNKAESDAALKYLAAKHKLAIPDIPTVANAIPDCNNTNAFDLSRPLNLIEIMYMTEVDRTTTPKLTPQALHDKFMRIFSSVPISDSYGNECKSIVEQINSYYASNINKSAMKLFASGIKVALPTRYTDIAIIPRGTPVANRLDMIVKNLAIGCVDKELLLQCILLGHLYATGDITQPSSTTLKPIGDIINIINGKMGSNPAIPANDKKLSLALLLFKTVNNEFKLQFDKSIKCSSTPCKLEESINIYNQYMLSTNDSTFNNDYNSSSNNLKILNISGVKFKTADLAVSSSSCQTPPQELANASKCNQFILASRIEQTYLDSNYDKCMDCNSENKPRGLNPNEPIPNECLELRKLKPQINRFILSECVASSPLGASSSSTTRPAANGATTTTSKAAVGAGAAGSTTTTTTKAAGAGAASGSSVTTTTTKKSQNGSSGDDWDPNSDEQPDDNNSNYNDYLKSLYGNSFDTNGDNSNWVNGGFGTANKNKLDTSTFNINDIGQSISGITGHILTNLGYAGFNPDETAKITRTYDNIEAGYSAGLSYPGSGNSGLGSGYPLSFSYSGGIGKHSSSVIQKDFNGVSNVFAPNIIFAGNGSPDLPSHIRAPKSSKTMST